MVSHLSVAATVVTVMLAIILALAGCGGGGGGDEAPPDYLLFYGDNTHSDNSISGSGLFKIEKNSIQTVKIINDSGKSHVQLFTDLGDRTVFSACGPSGCEPWITDGTTDGTHLIKDINRFGDSNPTNYTLFNGELYFSADDGEHGVELWKTDGTEKGTVMVKNIGIEQDISPLPPPTPVSGDPQELTVFKNALFFVANDIDYRRFGRGVELWKTDGSEEGTVMVKNIAIENPDNPAEDPDIAIDSSPHELTVFNGALFFAATDGLFGPDRYGIEPWKSDGTGPGTVIVKDIGTAGIAYDGDPQQFIAFDNALYFFSDDGVHGFEPWKSDGTERGTAMVANIGDDARGPFPATPDNLTFWDSLGGKLFFTADDGFTGVEPWLTDRDATGRLADINPLGDSVVAGRDDVFQVYNDQLFFVADDGIHGFEPWLSDGTSDGTLLIKDIYTTPINAPSEASGLKVLTEYQGQLYFTANDGLTGREIWTTDGTEIGTSILKDIGPGYESGYRDAFGPVNLDGALFFSAFDGRLTGGHGIEMWRTLGTKAETQLVEDLNPGAQYDGVLSASP
jgi:ELWxxDGT repeat protein